MYTYNYHNTKRVSVPLYNRKEVHITQQNRVCMCIWTMEFYLVIHCNFFPYIFGHIYNNFNNTSKVSRILLLRKWFLNYFTHLQATASNRPCYAPHRLESTVVRTNDGGCKIIVTTFRFLASVLALASLRLEDLARLKVCSFGFFYSSQNCCISYKSEILSLNLSFRLTAPWTLVYYEHRFTII